MTIGLPKKISAGWQLPDVLILDTDSRFDTPETTYNKVFEATRLLERAWMPADL